MSDPNREGRAIPSEVDSTLDPHTDLDALRDGGPTRTPGVMTTTGGSAGPASFGRRARPGAAPTTTGAAGSGGMNTPIGGGTSDNTTTGTGAAAVSGDAGDTTGGGTVGDGQAGDATGGGTVSGQEAREVMSAEGEDVVQPWEERMEVIEAGLDDTTAPPPAADDAGEDADPQSAHGGSMAPSLVDDTGRPVADPPPST